MTDLRLLPDAEQMTIAYLVQQPGVAGLVDDRVSADIPPDAEYPRVQVTLADMEISDHGYFAGAVLDIGAWADSKEDANDVIRTVHAALWEDQEDGFVGQREEGVVSGVMERVGIQWLPDPETNRPRYIMQMVVYVHRTPE